MGLSCTSLTDSIPPPPHGDYGDPDPINQSRSVNRRTIGEVGHGFDRPLFASPDPSMSTLDHWLPSRTAPSSVRTGQGKHARYHHIPLLSLWYDMAIFTSPMV